MIAQVGDWGELTDVLVSESSWQALVVESGAGSWIASVDGSVPVDVAAIGELGRNMSEPDILTIALAGPPIIVVRFGDDHEIAPAWLDDLASIGYRSYVTGVVEGSESEHIVAETGGSTLASLQGVADRALILVGDSALEGFVATLVSFLSDTNLALGEALVGERAATEEAKSGVRRRRARIAELDTAIAGRDERIAELDAAVAGRDRRIGELEGAMARRDERVAALEDAVAARDDRIESIAAVADDSAGIGDELEFLRRQYEEETSNRESMRAETVNLRLDLSRARRMLGVVSVVAAVLALATLALALT